MAMTIYPMHITYSFYAYKLIVIHINKDKECEIIAFGKPFAGIDFTQVVNRHQV